MFMFQARLSLRMSILWLSGRIYLTCAQLSIIGPPPHGAHNGGVYVVSEAVSDDRVVLLHGDHNGGVFVVSEAVSDEYGVLLHGDGNGDVFGVSEAGRDELKRATSLAVRTLASPSTCSCSFPSSRL